jgi:hypothetical protein
MDQKAEREEYGIKGEKNGSKCKELYKSYWEKE